MTSHRNHKKPRHHWRSWTVRILAALVVLYAAFCAVFAFGTRIDNATPREGYKCRYTLSEADKEQIKDMDAYEIVKYAIDQTCKKLKFRFKKTTEMDEGEGNCINYAALCTAIANEAFSFKGIKAKAIHEVGTIKILGLDFCKIAYAINNNGFYKDHDFVTFVIGADSISLDPSAKDLLGFDLKTVRKQR